MGKLTNLNPPNPIVDADIPAAIARDAEVTAALAAHLAAADPHLQYLTQSDFIKGVSVFPRTSPNAIDANSLMGGVAGGFQWIDSDAAHSNLPATTGTLIQFDSLFDTQIAGLYKIQFFVAGVPTSTTSKLYLRHQINGSWAPWRLV